MNALLFCPNSLKHLKLEEFHRNFLRKQRRTEELIENRF